MRQVARHLFLGVCLLGLSSGNAAELSSGVNQAGFDLSVRPQDDFYEYVNGRGLGAVEIPAYMPIWNSFTDAQIKTYLQLRTDLESLVISANVTGSDEQKIRDLYRSFMDEEQVNAARVAPLHKERARVARIASYRDVATVFGHFARIGIRAPIAVQVHQDNRNSTSYVVDFSQSGLGLPDRDYYLSAQSPFPDTRRKYHEHVERVLALAGAPPTGASADAIVALETKIAALQWTNAASREPVTTYNPEDISALPRFAPGIDWPRFLAAAAVAIKVGHVNVSQPTYLQGLAKLVSTTPVRVWRAYLDWCLLDQLSPYLSRDLVAEHDAFYGRIINDAPAGRPRWLQAVLLVDRSMGDALGKIYVDRHFPPESQQRANETVTNVLAAFRESLDTLGWLSPETRRQAVTKLNTLVVRLGYPKQWRDYTQLRISPTDLIGNLLRARAFAYDHELKRLGKPIDREEWRMTPQTVDAYYNAELNEFFIPAALMQPPIFQVTAEDAVNYGAFGFAIAHEISHGFDDRGSQFDSEGNLRDWWTSEDHERFAAKTKALIEQYARYESIPGYFVNGQLTLGENIADNSGLAIAYRAYHLSLKQLPAPDLDGLTGDQRFYVGFAALFAGRDRPADALRRIKVDEHSPMRFRVRGAIVNQDSFYTAFHVQEGDQMYVPPDRRIRIW